MFVMLEPTAVPTAISDAPWITDVMPATSSGREVPTATIVTPMRNGERPKANPIRSAVRTKMSAALTRQASAVSRTADHMASSNGGFLLQTRLDSPAFHASRGSGSQATAVGYVVVSPKAHRPSSVHGPRKEPRV